MSLQHSNNTSSNEAVYNEAELAKIYYEEIQSFKDLTKQIPQEIFNISKSKDKSGFITIGKVVDVSQKLKRAVIDVGLKAEGVVSLDEFIEDSKKIDVQVGDEYEVYVEDFDTKSKVISISRSKVQREKVWLKLKNAFEKGETVYGAIFKSINGGFAVDFDGILAFLPGSQVDIKIPKDISPILNIVQPFKIISISDDNTSDTSAKLLVVSRRAVIEENRSSKKDEFLQTINEGDIVQGVVKNIASYGAFIDLGTMDGLLHVADITWSKISHPSEAISIGDIVKAKVIKIDAEKKRISLGIKQIQNNPWTHLKEKYKEGDVIKAKISNKMDYGVFVLIEEDVEGLVHVSELAWTKDACQELHAKLSIGDELEVKIVSFDVENHKISLSRKETIHNPWKEFVETHSVGQKMPVKVVNVANFGIFVELDGNINGLIHVSDISWNGDNEQLIKNYKPEQQMEAVYLSGDYEKQRVSLGIKQLTEDPFEKNAELLKEGNLVDAKVVKVYKDEIDVELCDLVVCRIKKHNLPIEKISKSGLLYEIGEVVQVKVIKSDIAKRFILASARKAEDDVKASILKQQKTDSGSTLGNILGEAIALNENK